MPLMGISSPCSQKCRICTGSGAADGRMATSAIHDDTVVTETVS
jgi:hypothetical protein